MDHDPDSASAELLPLIRDLIRTRYCIPGSLFLVEGVDEIYPTRNKRWRAVRVLLGDGELCIQGLLTMDMHRFVDTKEVAVGCLVRLHVFRVVSEKLDHTAGPEEERRRLVYLAVEDLSVVGWHDEYVRLRSLKKPPGLKHWSRHRESEPRAQPLADLSPKRRSPVPIKQTAPESIQVALGESKPGDSSTKDSMHKTDAGDEDARGKELGSDDSDDGFEDLPAPETPTKARPRDTSRIPQSPVAMARDWTDTRIPLKLTPLFSINKLPYRQNWSVNVLAVVSSLSDPEPSTFPPYVQRIARLVDPSTPKRIHFTVFLEPEDFCPAEGSVVLLVGVKNHLFDGGSLKKYVSDRPKNGMGWWFQSPTFPWCQDKVSELQDWWTLLTMAEEEDS